MAQINDLFGVSVLGEDGYVDPEKVANGLGIWFFKEKEVAKAEAATNGVHGHLFKAKIAFDKPFECDILKFQKEYLHGQPEWRKKLIADGHDAVIVKNSGASYYLPLDASQIVVDDPNP